MDFIDVIKIKYDKLTASEKKVADYILKNSDSFLDSNAQRIGEETATSAATIIRFCKKMEFDSLENLKVNIAKSNLSSKENNVIDPILTKVDSDVDVVKKIYSQVDVSLKKTLSLIKFDVLGKVLEIIKKSENVYIYGIGASSLAAYDLYHKLNRVGKRSFYNFDGHMSIEFSIYSTPKDVAIAISYGGDSKEVLLAVEQAKKNNTPVIAIVKEGDTTLSKMVDYCLFVPNNEKRIRMGSLGSKFAQMLMIDILYFGVVRENLETVLEELKLTSDSIRPLKD